MIRTSAGMPPPPSRGPLAPLPILPGGQPPRVIVRLGHEIHADQPLPGVPQTQEDGARAAVADGLPLERRRMDQAERRGRAEDLLRLEGLVAAQVRLPDGDAELAGQAEDGL